MGEFEFLVRKAREHQVLINLISNGTLLSPERFEESADQIFRVELSIDSHRSQIFEELRPPARFDQVFAHTRGVVASATARGIPVVFVQVLSIRNVRDLPDFIRWVANLGGHAVRVLELLDNTPACADLQVLAHLREAELRSCLDQAFATAAEENVDLAVLLPEPFGRVQQVRETTLRMNGPDILSLFHGRLFAQYPSFCSQAATYLRIDPRGNVYPCCRSGRELLMGNLRTERFEDLWNGPSYQRLRSEHHTGELQEVCARCTLTQYPRATSPK